MNLHLNQLTFPLEFVHRIACGSARPNGTQDTKNDPCENSSSFAQRIETVKIEKRFSLEEMVSILCPVSLDTLKGWLYRGKLPSTAMQEDVLARLAASKTPSKAMQRHLADIYGLTWEIGKHRWRLRLTVDMGRKIVGKRVTIDLGRMTAEEAISAREITIKAYQRIGLSVRCRVQARKPIEPEGRAA